MPSHGVTYSMLPIVEGKVKFEANGKKYEYDFDEAKMIFIALSELYKTINI